MGKRKTKAKKISVAAAVKRFTQSAKKPFSLDEVVRYATSLVDGTAHTIARQAEAILSEDFRSFRDPSTNLYVPRCMYFQDSRFRMVPQKEEIKERILIPGHRFIPFCNPEIFPPDCTLILEDGSEVSRRKIKWPLERVLIYFTLFDIQNVADYLICEDERNARALSEGPPDAPVLVTAFDMAAVYAGCNFRQGDSFVLTTADWTRGYFLLVHSPQAEAQVLWKSGGRAWCNTLEDALEHVFDDLGPVVAIEQQLAYAFFRGGRTLLENPCIHIEGFLKRSKRIEMSQSGLSTILWRRGESPAEHLTFAPDLADLVAEGHADSLDSILQDLGVSLKSSEIEAYMRDELYRGEKSLEAVWRRCSAERDLIFYDRRQERALSRFLSELWEEVQSSYNRFTDHWAGKYRSQALHILDTQLAWLRKLDRKGVDLSELPAHEFLAFGQLTAPLGFLLESLNSGDPAAIKEDDQIKTMLEKMDHMNQFMMTLIEEKIPKISERPR